MRTRRAVILIALTWLVAGVLMVLPLVWPAYLHLLTRTYPYWYIAAGLPLAWLTWRILGSRARTARDPSKWKPNRRQRRVLIVLMTGAPGLSGYPISRLAQTDSGTVHIILARLEGLGWVDSELLDDGRRRRMFYRLTTIGRENVARMLGMESGS